MENVEERFSRYYDNYDLFMKKYVVPEVYARQLAVYYYENLIGYETLYQYAGSIGNAFNVSYGFEDIRKEIEEILRIKYDLKITKDEPLIMEKCNLEVIDK